MVNNELGIVTNVIDNAFVNRLSKISTVESVFVIGSMVDPNYSAKQSNDYDIRVWVSSVTDKVFEEIQNSVDDCKKILSNPWYNESSKNPIYLSYSDIIGPVKHITHNDGVSLLVHCILLTDSSYYGLPMMHRLSYAKNHKVLWGKNCVLKDIGIKLSMKGILNDTEGLKYCIDHIKDGEFQYLKWHKLANNQYVLKSKTEVFNNESMFEFLKYSVEKNTNNLIAFFEQKQQAKYIEKILKIKKDFMPLFVYEIFQNKVDYYLTITKAYLIQLLDVAVDYEREEIV